MRKVAVLLALCVGDFVLQVTEGATSLSEKLVSPCVGQRR